MTDTQYEEILSLSKECGQITKGDVDTLLCEADKRGVGRAFARRVLSDDSVWCGGVARRILNERAQFNSEL